MTTAARGRFWLTVVSFNLGRKYAPGVFRANVLRILEHTDGREHVVLLPQELDEEPDPANEHRVLARELVPGSRRVYWRTREPIILSPSFKVRRRRRIQTMPAGLDLGPGLDGTGPARHAVTCIAEEQRTGIRLAFGNTHPHRRGLDPRVEDARYAGEQTFRAELQRARHAYGGTSGLWGADMNDTRVPMLVPGEQVAIRRGLDHLRFWEHPAGARLELLNAGRLEGTIDPHDPLYARFHVEARDAR